MSSDDEKDPPVPGDLVGASKRVHRDQDDRPDHAGVEEKRSGWD